MKTFQTLAPIFLGLLAAVTAGECAVVKKEESIGSVEQSKKPESSWLLKLSDDVRKIAEDAKAAFDKAKYSEAVRLYEKALETHPGNIYLRSNLGVTQFRMGKLDDAEATFGKALEIDPKDGMCLRVLGIVQYSRSKYAAAEESLKKAIEIDPKDATAQKYLVITFSQIGQIEKALRELKTALELDPKYGDACFNMSVVLATKTPPDKASAKEFYEKAIELGAEADPAMEALLK